MTHAHKSRSFLSGCRCRPSKKVRSEVRDGSDDRMNGRPSVVDVARSLLQRQRQQQQQQKEGGIPGSSTLPTASASPQQQELHALTAGEISDLCFLQKAAANRTLPYEALDPFAIDAALRVPQSDPRSLEHRLMALRDALGQIK